MPRRLPRAFFDRSALDVAADLLGAHVVHSGVTVRLTEVEAYAGIGDPGSHAFRGRTPRTATLFGPPGGLYVYFTYGMHWCANLVTGPEGSGAAVLLRAGEVVAGTDLAIDRRHGAVTRELARGPARLAVCLGFGREHDGILTPRRDSPVRVERPTPTPRRVRSGPRVGVSGPGGDGTAYPWRLWLDGEPTVSAYRPAVARRRPR